VKVLSVRQPWAWAIIHGFKPVENRNRRTSYRGEFLVHAPLTFDKAGLAFIVGQGIPVPDTFELGGIVGKSRIVNVVDELDSPWFFGPRGWLLADSEPLPFFEVKGKLGLWELAWPQPEAT
jgi:hypothetical protein